VHLGLAVLDEIDPAVPAFPELEDFAALGWDRLWDSDGD